MRELPILFQGAMVRAILPGTKTQTRRVVRPQPAYPSDVKGVMRHPGVAMFGVLADAAVGDEWRCPYGQPGDRLWVRETFYAFGRWETRFSAKKGRDEWHFVDMTLECDRAYQYDADGAPQFPVQRKRSAGITPGWWKRPAIFMPRAASRILLEVSGVRVERLQDISEADARAEGCAPIDLALVQGEVRKLIDLPLMDDEHPYRNGYACLWESINGAGSWGANPWVWCVSFRRIEPVEQGTVPQPDVGASLRAALGTQPVKETNHG